MPFLVPVCFYLFSIHVTVLQYPSVTVSQQLGKLMKLHPSYPVGFTVHCCDDVNRIISRIGLADAVHLLYLNRVADNLFCFSLSLTSNIDIWSYRNAVLIEPPIQ